MVLYAADGRVTLDQIVVDDGTPLIPNTYLLVDGTPLFRFINHTIPNYTIVSTLQEEAIIGSYISYNVTLTCTNHVDPHKPLSVDMNIPISYNLISATSNEGSFDSDLNRWTPTLKDDVAVLNIILEPISAGEYTQTINLVGTSVSSSNTCEISSSDPDGDINYAIMGLDNYPTTLNNMQDGKLYTVVSYLKSQGPSDESLLTFNQRNCGEDGTTTGFDESGDETYTNYAAYNVGNAGINHNTTGFSTTVGAPSATKLRIDEYDGDTIHAPQRYQGDTSLKVVCGGHDITEGVVWTITGLTPGNTYTAQIRVRRNGVENLTWRVAEDNEAGYWTTSIPESADFERLTHTFIAASNGESENRVYHSSNISYEEFYVDSIMVTSGSDVYEWVAGAGTGNTVNFERIYRPEPMKAAWLSMLGLFGVYPRKDATMTLTSDGLEITTAATDYGQARAATNTMEDKSGEDLYEAVVKVIIPTGHQIRVYVVDKAGVEIATSDAVDGDDGVEQTVTLEFENDTSNPTCWLHIEAVAMEEFTFKITDIQTPNPIPVLEEQGLTDLILLNSSWMDIREDYDGIVYGLEKAQRYCDGSNIRTHYSFKTFSAGGNYYDVWDDTATDDLVDAITNLMNDIPDLGGICFDDFMFPFYKNQIYAIGGEYSNRGHYKTTFTVDTDNDYIVKSDHGLATGDIILFTGANLPAGLYEDTGYNIIKIDNNRFRVAVNMNYVRETTPYYIDITDSGSGTFYYHSCSDSQARAQLASWCETVVSAIHTAGKIASYAGLFKNRWGNYLEDMAEIFDVIYPETYKTGNVMMQPAYNKTKSFVEASVNTTTNKIRVNVHGLQTGDPVTFYSEGILPSPLKSFDIDQDDINTTNNQITISGHGFSEDDEVRIVATTLTSGTYVPDGGSVPGGLEPEHNYYVHVVNSSTIQLAEGYTRSIVDITSVATGTYKVSQVYYVRRSDNDYIYLYDTLKHSQYLGDTEGLIDITDTGTLSGNYHKLRDEDRSASLKVIGSYDTAQDFIHEMITGLASISREDTCKIVPILDMEDYRNSTAYDKEDMDEEIERLDAHNVQGYGLFALNYITPNVDFSSLTLPDAGDSFIRVSTQGINSGEGVKLTVEDDIIDLEISARFNIKAPAGSDLTLQLGTTITNDFIGTGDWEEITIQGSPNSQDIYIVTASGQAIEFFIDNNDAIEGTYFVAGEGIKTHIFSVMNTVEYVGNKLSVDNEYEKMVCSFIYDDSEPVDIRMYGNYSNLNVTDKSYWAGLCINEGLNTNYTSSVGLLDDPDALYSDEDSSDIIIPGDSTSAEYIYTINTITKPVGVDDPLFTGIEVDLNSFSTINSGVEVYIESESKDNSETGVSETKSGYISRTGKYTFGDAADMWEFLEKDVFGYKHYIHLKFMNTTLNEHTYSFNNLSESIYWIEDVTGGHLGFTAKGVHSKVYQLYLLESDFNQGPNINTQTLGMPGMDGELPVSSDIKMGEKTLEFLVYGDTIDDAVDKLRNINRWLRNERIAPNVPVTYPIIFDYDPSMQYDVIFDENIDVDPYVNSLKCKAKFKLPDNVARSVYPVATGHIGSNPGIIKVYPTIEVMSDGSNSIEITDTITGYTITLNETITEGTILYFDCAARTVTDIEGNDYTDELSVDNVWISFYDNYDLTVDGGILQQIIFYPGY